MYYTNWRGYLVTYYWYKLQNVHVQRLVHRAYHSEMRWASSMAINFTLFWTSSLCVNIFKTCVTRDQWLSVTRNLLAVRFLLVLKYNIKRPVIRPGPGVIHIGGLITVWECLQYTRILRHNAALMGFAGNEERRQVYMKIVVW